MIKEIFLILGGGIAAIIILGVSLKQFGGKNNIFVPPIQEQTSTSSSLINTLQSSLNAGSPKEEVVSLDGKGTVEVFLKAITNHKPEEAIQFMAPKTVGDENQKQAWGVLFNAFQTCTVKSIDPSMQGEWTKTTEGYKVTLDVEMKKESANAPIPYYGYTKGINIRWIHVEKIGGVWKVLDIATGS